jgi:hypothetical protein
MSVSSSICSEESTSEETIDQKKLEEPAASAAEIAIKDAANSVDQKKLEELWSTMQQMLQKKIDQGRLRMETSEITLGAEDSETPASEVDPKSSILYIYVSMLESIKTWMNHYAQAFGHVGRKDVQRSDVLVDALIDRMECIDVLMNDLHIDAATFFPLLKMSTEMVNYANAWSLLVQVNMDHIYDAAARSLRPGVTDASLCHVKMSAFQTISRANAFVSCKRTEGIVIYPTFSSYLPDACMIGLDPELLTSVFKLPKHESGVDENPPVCIVDHSTLALLGFSKPDSEGKTAPYPSTYKVSTRTCVLNQMLMKELSGITETYDRLKVASAASSSSASASASASASSSSSIPPSLLDKHNVSPVYLSSIGTVAFGEMNEWRTAVETLVFCADRVCTTLYPSYREYLHNTNVASAASAMKSQCASGSGS